MSSGIEPRRRALVVVRQDGLGCLAGQGTPARAVLAQPDSVPPAATMERDAGPELRRTGGRRRRRWARGERRDRRPRPGRGGSRRRRVGSAARTVPAGAARSTTSARTSQATVRVASRRNGRRVVVGMVPRRVVPKHARCIRSTPMPRRDHGRGYPNDLPGGYAVDMDLRCFLGHGASGTAASMTPYVEGLRARGVDGDRDRPAAPAGRGRRPGLPSRRPGGWGRGRRRPVLRRARRQPRGGGAGRSIRRARAVLLPAAPAGRHRTRRRRGSAHWPSIRCPGPAAVRANRIRSPGSTCCAPPSRGSADRPNWSRIRGSATASNRCSRTPWTGPPPSSTGVAG